jgi:hypothetical protein
LQDVAEEKVRRKNYKAVATFFKRLDLDLTTIKDV